MVKEFWSIGQMSMHSQEINCPFCGGKIGINEAICPHCLREIPQDIQAYDFDFIKRANELHSINTKWIHYPPSQVASRHLFALAEPLKDFIFEVFEEGHPPGKETIKQKFEISEVLGEIFSPFLCNGYRLGLEYGSRGNHSKRIEIVEDFPQEVQEMFFVANHVLLMFFLHLFSKIVDAHGMDEKHERELSETFIGMSGGTLINCYKYGVATAQEN